MTEPIPKTEHAPLLSILEYEVVIPLCFSYTPPVYIVHYQLRIVVQEVPLQSSQSLQKL